MWRDWNETTAPERPLDLPERQVADVFGLTERQVQRTFSARGENAWHRYAEDGDLPPKRDYPGDK
jgi:hypothetical protein